MAAMLPLFSRGSNSRSSTLEPGARRTKVAQTRTDTSNEAATMISRHTALFNSVRLELNMRGLAAGRGCYLLCTGVTVVLTVIHPVICFREQLFSCLTIGWINSKSHTERDLVPGGRASRDDSLLEFSRLM